jgi:hypothetical protein
MVLKVATSLNLNGPVYYQGTWDANANTPFLQSGVGFSGEYYIVSVAGNTTLDGYTNWQVGDWAVFNGALDKWVKVGSSALGTTLEIVNDTSSNTTYKIAMTTATSGLIDKEYVDDIGLVFNPAGTGYASSAFKTKSGKFTGTLVLTQSWTDDSKAFVLGEAYATNGGTITMYTPGDSGNFSLEPVAWNKYGWLGIGISTSLSYQVPYPLTVTNTFGSPTTQVFVTEDADQSTNGLKIGHISSASNLTSSGTLALGSNATIRLTFNTSGAFGIGAAPSYGTANQVLTSQGNAALPTWSNVSGAAVSHNLVTKTANYTATAADETILVNAAGLVTITLPTAVGITGKIYTIKKVDATSYATTVATTSSQTIDGLSTFPLPNQWGGVNVQSDGANWVIVGTINGRNGTTGSF